MIPGMIPGVIPGVIPTDCDDVCCLNESEHIKMTYLLKKMDVQVYPMWQIYH